MCESLRDAIAFVGEWIARLDPESLSGPEAVELFDEFAKVERFAAAGRTMTVRRIEETKAWYGSAYPNVAKWLAGRGRTTLGSAVKTLETARHLETLPDTRDAFISGLLSPHQVEEIAAAGAVDPTAEPGLLEEAEKSSVNGLREACRRVIAAASQDADTDERIHRSRYFRHWIDTDGSVRVDGKFTQDDGAKLIAAVKARRDLLYEKGRSSGRRERRQAYAADAVIQLVEGSEPGPKSIVSVLIDWEALQRGRVTHGEICEVPGIGPISVAAAKRLSEDAVIRAILKDGADVRAVGTVGRHIPARVRAAVEARDTVCIVGDCDERDDREFHHLVPVAEGGPTTVDNLVLPCTFHHMLITHCGWRLEGGHGKWRLLPPKRRTAPDGRAPPPS